MGLPGGPGLVAMRRPPAAVELRAFLLTLRHAAPDRLTQCGQWGVHELVAHLAAGALELAGLLEARTSRPTRDFSEREEPFRTLGDGALRRALVVEGLRLADAIERRSAPVMFTGRLLTVDQVITHVRSELVLHRWDITGGDDIDEHALADPALVAHVIECVQPMEPRVLPPLPWAARAGSVALHSDGAPDVVVATKDGHRHLRFAGPGDLAPERVRLHPAARTLILWGRQPPETLLPGPTEIDGVPGRPSE